MSVGGRACSLHDVIPAAVVVVHDVEACFVVAACVLLLGGPPLCAVAVDGAWWL